MSRLIGRDAVDGYVWLNATVERSGGPERVYTAPEPDPEFKPRPVGFTAEATS
jgi:hypothetical protein